MPFGRRGYYKYAVFQSSVDTRRLARRLVVQEQCLKDCAERGIEIESAANPSLFKSTTPHGIFVRQIGGAVSEYDSRMAYEQLRNGAPFQKKIPLLSPEGSHRSLTVLDCWLCLC